MGAPTPRTPDGKPDLSGNWVPFRGEGAFATPELRGLTRNQAATAQTPAPPKDPNSPPIAAFWEIGANVPDGLPFTPWASELKQRMADTGKENSNANCLPMGLTQFHMHGQPHKIMQNAGVIAIICEANYGLRYIYVDGRPLPPQGSVQPFWCGYSVGEAAFRFHLAGPLDGRNVGNDPVVLAGLQRIAVVIAAVGQRRQRRNPKLFLGGLGHLVKLTGVVAVIDDLAPHDELVLVVHRDLDVVAGHHLAPLRQQPGVQRQRGKDRVCGRRVEEFGIKRERGEFETDVRHE
ncbi:MAG TPA: hypothetical protein VKP67_20470 [Xanthobacteraceae bacterium]|nr:hypothetical protein [Xanthobacteraceae bacterium]